MFNNNMYAPQKAAAQGQLARGANWIYYIAGLSLLYTIVDATGGHMMGVVGLGTIAALPSGAVATAVGILLSATFGVLGYFAHQRRPWAFIAVIALYAIDGLVNLTVGNILGAIFHGWGLFLIVRAFLAIAQVNHWENVATQQMVGYPAPPPVPGAWPPPPGVPMGQGAPMPVGAPPPSGQWLGSQPAQQDAQWASQQPAQPQWPAQQPPNQQQWPSQQPAQPTGPNQQPPAQ